MKFLNNWPKQWDCSHWWRKQERQIVGWTSILCPNREKQNYHKWRKSRKRLGHVTGASRYTTRNFSSLIFNSPNRSHGNCDWKISVSHSLGLLAISSIFSSCCMRVKEIKYWLWYLKCTKTRSFAVWKENICQIKITSNSCLALPVWCWDMFNPCVWTKACGEWYSENFSRSSVRNWRLNQ